MALNRISKFNWDKLLAKAPSSDVANCANLFQSTATEITGLSARVAKEPEKIDFDGYKKKLRFTSAAVDKLQAVYNNRNLPKYSYSVPEFELKKREEMVKAAKAVVDAALEDIKDLQKQLEELDTSPITNMDEAFNRFPDIGRKVEAEIKNNQWA